MCAGTPNSVLDVASRQVEQSGPGTGWVGPRGGQPAKRWQGDRHHRRRHPQANPRTLRHMESTPATPRMTTHRDRACGAEKSGERRQPGQVT